MGRPAISFVMYEKLPDFYDRQKNSVVQCIILWNHGFIWSFTMIIVQFESYFIDVFNITLCFQGDWRIIYFQILLCNCCKDKNVQVEIWKISCLAFTVFTRQSVDKSRPSFTMTLQTDLSPLAGPDHNLPRWPTSQPPGAP